MKDTAYIEKTDKDTKTYIYHDQNGVVNTTTKKYYIKDVYDNC